MGKKTSSVAQKAMDEKARREAPYRLARIIAQAYAAKKTAGPYYGATFPYRNPDGSPWTGMCASLTRRFYQATHKGEAFPFAQKDADRDGDVDANDMKALETKGMGGVSYAVTGPGAFEKAVKKGLLRVGGRCYLTGEGYGHVVTIVRIRTADTLSGIDVLENTTSTLRGPGTLLTTLDRVCLGRPDRIAAVGFYGTGVFL